LIIKKIIKPDEGLVGIVVTVLIIGLIIVVSGIVQSVYVPQWLEQKEADHMYVVSYQFAQFKQSLDILSVIGQKNAISTYITLGTSEMPIFGTGRTDDYLSILSDNCTIEVANNTKSYSFSLGTVKYSSENSYYVDQSYIYEAGALILSQSGGSILNGKPFFSISNFTNVSFYIINISSFEGKKNAGGHGTYSFYIEYLNSTYYTIDSFRFINITTNYQNAWGIFFNETSLKYSSLDYEIKDTDYGISVEFSGTLGNLILKVSELYVQMAPGWVK